MKLKFDISTEEFKIIKQLLEQHLPNCCRAWVFGSRAKNTAKFNSDLDLALDCKTEIAQAILINIKEGFEGSKLPFMVDVVDMNKIDPDFKKIIDKQKTSFPLKNSAKVPQLRFPEFSGERSDEQRKDYPDWEIFKLGFIAECLDNKRIPLNEGERNKRKGSIPYWGANGILDYVDDYIFDETIVLLAEDGGHFDEFHTRPIASISYGKSWVNNHAHVLRAKRKASTNEYLYHSLVHKNILGYVNGGTRAKLNKSDMLKISLSIPSLDEQQKIAAFLSSIDSKIEQLNQKKALLERYKKGVMQKLFSQKIRFKDERGKDYPDWEEMSLGSVGKTFNGLTGKNSEHFGKGKHYIQYLQVFESSKINIDKFGLVNISENESQNTVRYGDVFFTTSSETSNEVGTASVLMDEVKDTYLNSFCFGYRIDQERLLPGFARYALRECGFRKKVVRLAQGSTRYNLSKISLMKIKTEFPVKQEQEKISAFLSVLDRKIELVAAQIKQVQTFKKGLLQQIFV